MTDRYAVFGNPVKQSKSPLIHSLFAAQTGDDIEYTSQLVEIGSFADSTRRFFDSGGMGLNITVPFKQDAYRFASQLTPVARRAGAVNTLARQPDDSIVGDTTDGIGMIRDIVGNQGWTIQGKRLLLLGAGGAVRGVLAPLLEQGPAELVIANRTLEKARLLAREFRDLAEVEACGFADLGGRQFDLVINGTSASLTADLPPLPDALLASGANCYDMVYASEPTVFLRWAKQQGAVGQADGLGMLVEQAAESYRIWRGKSPDTGPVIARLRTL